MCSDPRYCPPECDLGPPSADGDSDKVSVEQLGDFWATYQPASFDVYSAGVVLMQVRRACVVYLAFDGGLPAPSSITGGRIQLAVPALREEAALVAFNQQLAAEGYELAAWKQGAGAGVAADVLDVNGGAGWALVRPTAARPLPSPGLSLRCDVARRGVATATGGLFEGRSDSTWANLSHSLTRWQAALMLGKPTWEYRERSGKKAKGGAVARPTAEEALRHAFFQKQ